MPPNRGNSILTSICCTSGTSAPRRGTILDHLGVPKLMQKSGLEPTPQKVTKHVPRVTKKRCQKALRGYLESPEMVVVASNPLHKRCLASSMLRKRWRQGGGGGVHDLPTTCRRLADDLPTRISGSQLPSRTLPGNSRRQDKILESTTRTEKEGKHEGKVISHTPYTLLRRVGG